MRLQLALNVSNLEESIAFCSNLFDAEPAKIKPGYANFAIENPPLKLVLFEAADGAAGGTINHLGVETETADEVTSAQERLAAAGLAPTPIADTECCFAEKVETWVSGPDGSRWEWYVKTGDTESIEMVTLGTRTCCPE